MKIVDKRNQDWDLGDVVTDGHKIGVIADILGDKEGDEGTFEILYIGEFLNGTIIKQNGVYTNVHLIGVCNPHWDFEEFQKNNSDFHKLNTELVIKDD